MNIGDHAHMTTDGPIYQPGDDPFLEWRGISADLAWQRRRVEPFDNMDSSGPRSIGTLRVLSINYHTLSGDATIPGDHMRSYAPTGNYLVSIVVEDEVQIRHKEFFFDSVGLRRFNELLKESRVYKEFIEPYYKTRGGQ